MRRLDFIKSLLVAPLALTPISGLLAVKPEPDHFVLDDPLYDLPTCDEYEKLPRPRECEPLIVWFGSPDESLIDGSSGKQEVGRLIFGKALVCEAIQVSQVRYERLDSNGMFGIKAKAYFKVLPENRSKIDLYW